MRRQPIHRLGVARHTVTPAIDPAITDAVVALRKQRPTWGPRKLLARLSLDRPEIVWPASSTIGDFLHREGLSKPRSRRARDPSRKQPEIEPLAANESWSADFKGVYWLTVDTATLKNRRNGYEYQALVRLAEALPDGVEVCIVADRGFGDHKLYRVLTEELKFDFVIRFRGNIMVTAADGETRTAAEWIGKGGHARVLRGATVTALGYPVGAVVCVQAKDMKEPWCLATSTTDKAARELINLYAKRWGIECGFRDSKDIRFGMGMGEVHVSTPDRRDRLWLINAFAIALLTLLGAAGEALGYDRHLKSNTTKRRTHSLLRQGDHALPADPEHAGTQVTAPDRTVHRNARRTRTRGRPGRASSRHTTKRCKRETPPE